MSCPRCQVVDAMPPNCYKCNYPGPRPEPKMGAGKIIGIIIASLLGLGLLATGVIFLFKGLGAISEPSGPSPEEQWVDENTGLIKATFTLYLEDFEDGHDAMERERYYTAQTHFNSAAGFTKAMGDEMRVQCYKAAAPWDCDEIREILGELTYIAEIVAGCMGEFNAGYVGDDCEEAIEVIDDMDRQISKGLDLVEGWVVN